MWCRKLLWVRYQRGAHTRPVAANDHQTGKKKPCAALLQCRTSLRRNTPSTAGNSMTSSKRLSPEPFLKKEASPAVLGGREFWIHALKASNALNYRVWGIPAVLSREIPGNALRVFPGSFRNFSGISSGKSQPYWGYGPFKVPFETSFTITFKVYLYAVRLFFIPLKVISQKWP